MTDLPIQGVAVGHATDPALGSGVTAVLFDPPAIASVAVLGGAPGGWDTDALEPESTLERMDALVLSGGSAFGLEAMSGVQAALREAGRGLEMRGVVIPLVAGAILFDLANGGNKAWGRFSPYRDLGYAATYAARAGAVDEGSVGAGTGATTATVKGGLGVASMTTSAGHTVAAIIAVNALGAPTMGNGKWFWAAPFEQGDEFGGHGWPHDTATAGIGFRVKGAAAPSTTIGVVITDAALTKAQAKRLAIMSHDGLSRAVLPAHAPMDGDTLFAASTGARGLAHPVREVTEIGYAATLVVARAIARGIYRATALPVPGAQPSWRDRYGT